MAQRRGDDGARHRRWSSNVMTLAFLVLGYAAVMALAWNTLWRGSTSELDGAIVPTPTVPEPIVGFSFDDAMLIGVDLEGDPVVLIPDCFGKVTRVAIVSDYWRATDWEIEAIRIDNPPELGTVSVGVAPDGFRTVVPLAERALPTEPTDLVVVNGPDNIGFAVLERVNLRTEPDGCD